jgi:L-ascorbate metabolism protein UlaG (beta-lactamase superfamily)
VCESERVLRVTYVGHGTVQFESGGTRLLTDPVLRSRIGHLRRLVPLTQDAEMLRPDAVLISHAHFDHLDVGSLRLLDPCPVIAPPGCARVLAKAGLREVEEMRPGDELRVGDFVLTASKMVHDGRRHPASMAKIALGFTLDCGERAFFAGDTDVFPGMGRLAGGIDVAMLPIWGWGPRVGKGHMNPERAAEAAALLAPRTAIPIHWGTLASPRAGWTHDPQKPARDFGREVAARAPGVEVRVLQPGEGAEFSEPQ